MRPAVRSTDTPRTSLGTVRVRADDVQALDTNHSGAITDADVVSGAHLAGVDDLGRAVDVPLTHDPHDVGRAARIYSFVTEQAHARRGEDIAIPDALLTETSAARALLAADSYAPFVRTTRIPDVLDALLAHPDTKLGVGSGGIAGRTYPVVVDGKLEQRTATYDGKHAYVYVADERDFAALERAKQSSDKYAHIEVRRLTRAQMEDPEERNALKFDRPGMFYVSSRCPLLPNVDDEGYLVPGGRFGMELYYHDARAMMPGARDTIQRGGAEAERALSAMRGTATALVNEVLTYGKAFNASMTTSASRTQAPCLTTAIRDTYDAWVALHPEQKSEARTWLQWAYGAAVKEMNELWLASPRFDAKTGLSRYVDENPSAAPEEVSHFYEGIEWSAEDIASDAAVREHGWDSMTAALLTDGPDKGKPRTHHLLPVCLNSLLYVAERNLAAIAREVGGKDGEQDARAWDSAAAKRKATMDELMWSEAKGVYLDVVQPPGHEVDRPRKNGAEDARSLMPMWAGLVDDDPARAKRMQARTREYVRPAGLATATPDAWRALRKLNPAYVDRCQWGHKDIGWPIATLETVEGLRRTGAGKLADEIAYRWCKVVLDEMETSGGLHIDPRGGFTAPVFEKMDVSGASSSKKDAAEVGYGNQGAGNEGAGGGFRWGLDAFKVLYRGLSPVLRAQLDAGTDADAVFDARVRRER